MAGVDTGITLSAKHCIEIGRQAIAEGYYYQAVDWMETALVKTRLQRDTTASPTEAKIQFQMAKKVVRLTRVRVLNRHKISFFNSTTRC